MPSTETESRRVHTVQSLTDDLRGCGVDSRGTLFVHSSLKAVGACENGADTILDALMSYMREGLLVLPTHTWDTIDEKNNVYDPLTEPSCVGILPELFRKRPGVVRSWHPTHSMAAIGCDAADFIAGEEKTSTPCPRDGCYGRLYDRKAQILFLGCDLTKNTFLHAVEEWNHIPRRIADTPRKLYVRTAGGLLPYTQYGHIPGMDVSRTYNKMEPAFIRAGVGRYGRVGDAHSVLCDAAGMAALVGRYLKKDPDLFGHDRPLTEQL